jgi:hypothetical protein
MDLKRITRLITSCEKHGANPFIIRDSKVQITQSRSQILKWKIAMYTCGFYTFFLFSRTIAFASKMSRGESDSKTFYNLNICIALGASCAACLTLHCGTLAQMDKVPMLVNGFISYVEWFRGKGAFFNLG